MAKECSRLSTPRKVMVDSDGLKLETLLKLQESKLVNHQLLLKLKKMMKQSISEFNLTEGLFLE